MRIGIYGDALALALIASAEVAESANQTVVWRNDVMFKSDQTEPFNVVVALESSFAAPGIAAAYRAKDGVAVFIVPQVDAKHELLASDEFRAYAEYLGIALPSPEQLQTEIEAEAKAREAANAALAAVSGTPEAPQPVEGNTETSDAEDSDEPLLPKIADLAAHLQTITAVDALLDLMQRDTRKTAAPIYEARFAELTAVTA